MRLVRGCCPILTTRNRANRAQCVYLILTATLGKSKLQCIFQHSPKVAELNWTNTRYNLYIPAKEKDEKVS